MRGTGGAKYPSLAMAASRAPIEPWTRPRRARVRAVRDRLRELYGRPVNQPHGHPIAELVRTILSQNTNDRNRDVAYERLRAALPTWVEVREADLAEVEEAIRPGGLAPRRRRGSSRSCASSPTTAASRPWTGSPRPTATRRSTFLVELRASGARPPPA